MVAGSSAVDDGFEGCFAFVVGHGRGLQFTVCRSPWKGVRAYIVERGSLPTAGRPGSRCRNCECGRGRKSGSWAAALHKVKTAGLKPGTTFRKRTGLFSLRAPSRARTRDRPLHSKKTTPKTKTKTRPYKSRAGHLHYIRKKHRSKDRPLQMQKTQQETEATTCTLRR